MDRHSVIAPSAMALDMCCRITTLHMWRAYPLSVVEALDSLEKAQVAFLDQIEELETSSNKLLRNADHETEVRLDERTFGILITGFNRLCKSDFLCCRQQINLTYLLQVHAHRVGHACIEAPPNVPNCNLILIVIDLSVLARSAPSRPFVEVAAFFLLVFMFVRLMLVVMIIVVEAR